MLKEERRKKLKLLYVTREGFPTFRVDIKMLFGKFMPRQGIDTSLIAYKTNEPQYQWPHGQIFIYTANLLSVAGKLSDFFHSIHYAWKLAPKYDAIQVRDKAFVALILIIVAKLRRRPIFFWMSFPFDEADLVRSDVRGIKANFFKIIFFRLRGMAMSFVQYRLVFRSVDHVFVQSCAMQDYLYNNKGIPTELMTVVPMGIDMDLVEAFLQKTYSSPYVTGEFVIANLGVLTSFRGLSFVLDIMEQLVGVYPNVRLIIIGGSLENKELQGIEREIQQRGMAEFVSLTGWLEQKEAWKILSYAHLGINLLEKIVLTETMSPTKVMEYAALGIPCVVTDIIDQKKVVTQCQCGICVPYDKEKIISAITEMIEVPEKRRSFGLNGMQKIGMLRGYDSISRKLSEVYKEKMG